MLFSCTGSFPFPVILQIDVLSRSPLPPQVKFHLLRKSTGEAVKVRYLCDEPFFTFHHVNAYEVKGHLVVDIITYPSPEILDKFYLNKIRAQEFDVKDAPQLQRFILPLLADLQVRPRTREREEGEGRERKRRGREGRGRGKGMGEEEVAGGGRDEEEAEVMRRTRERGWEVKGKRGGRRSIGEEPIGMISGN